MPTFLEVSKLSKKKFINPQKKVNLLTDECKFYEAHILNLNDYDGGKE